ncbi:hypothetical protein M413DRAFT_27253 [Hebeloma cylindrosporum]|uniref:SAP domain-containing protein n=1 Tax=Hebeloma cylindrosporum TaxID=76867 RepID=A0A0C3BYJ6_HEBCY|nr:hypothetical protein M413DRAFT_27253 [Hebeloma cylindrosporum h7]
MAPVAYSGALPPKKKSELQEIAVALRLSDQGTKDELQARIKKHLDNNQDALEEDPRFAGLFGRRKRSVQPQSSIPSGRFAPSSESIDKPRSSTGRRVTALDPINETPTKDLRDVSTFLKRPHSPVTSTPNQSPRGFDAITPSSLPPLPPSPSKSIIDHLPNAAEVKAAVQQFQPQEVLQNGNELLIALRAFLSNSRNIWSLAAVFELLFILSAIIPWATLKVPITPRGDAGTLVSVPYPPWSVFQSPAFWQVLLHWAIPTLIAPAFIGCIISFNPANAPPTSNPADAPIAPFDPLTASIIRLAAQIAYPYTAVSARTNVVGLDVLGYNWRILSASVGLAFSFAEAISAAPQVFAKSLIHQQRLGILNGEREATPNRRVIMEHAEVEID